MQIEQVIGNYQEFFSDLLSRLKNSGINITGMSMSHLLYRVTTIPEYLQLRDKLITFCSRFVETQFNGRAVSILILKEPLELTDGFTVPMIELPAPRPSHMYPSGLESIGVILGEELNEFNVKHHKILSGIKEHGEHCQPSFITFDNNKTAKFYYISLEETVIRQGWTIENVAHADSTKKYPDAVK